MPDSDTFLRAVSRSVVSSESGLAVDPASIPGTPPVVIELMNYVRSVHVEVVALATILQGRGLITDVELNKARMVVVNAMDQAFTQQIEQLGRGLAQKPTFHTAAPKDPRRAP
jgi:hypothetical protein